MIRLAVAAVAVAALAGCGGGTLPDQTGQTVDPAWAGRTFEAENPSIDCHWRVDHARYNSPRVYGDHRNAVVTFEAGDRHFHSTYCGAWTPVV